MMNKIKVFLGIKYILWVVSLGITIGSCSALFLFVLDCAQFLRNESSKMIYLLPFSGLVILYLYLNVDNTSILANNLLIRAYRDSKQDASWKMAPLIFVIVRYIQIFQPLAHVNSITIGLKFS